MGYVGFRDTCFSGVPIRRTIVFCGFILGSLQVKWHFEKHPFVISGWGMFCFVV